MDKEKNEEQENLEIKELKLKISSLEKNKPYGLVWEEKNENVDSVINSNLPIFKELENRSITTNHENNNILINGENYHALISLSYTHSNSIDLIYIDPPYNTGNKDFIYNDNFVEREDLYRHSKWLTFINKRLILAKQLLNDDGLIFISIGEDEYAQLKLLCDQIFGESNYVTNFLWEKTQHFGRQKVNFYSNADFILCYAKNLKSSSGLKELLVEKIKNNLEDAPLYNASNPINEITFPKKSVEFRIPDGTYTKSQDEKFKLLSKVIVKNGLNENEFRLKFKSRWSPDKVKSEIKNGTTYLIKSEKFSVRAEYPSEKTSLESPKQILFTNRNNEFVSMSRFSRKVGTNEEGSKELTQIVGDQDAFDYPKPVSLISYLISLYFHNGNHPNDIKVLDFFAGSGTTGHAVLELNKEDGGNRQFILVTNNENNIAEEVTYPRLKNVINGYKNLKNEKVEGLGGNLKYYEIDFVPADNSDPSMYELAINLVDTLCLKENTFTEHHTSKDIKIFKNKEDHYCCIVFDEDKIDQALQKLNNTDGSYSFYIYSLGGETFDEELEDFISEHPNTISTPFPLTMKNIYKSLK